MNDLIKITCILINNSKNIKYIWRVLLVYSCISLIKGSYSTRTDLRLVNVGASRNIIFPDELTGRRIIQNVRHQNVRNPTHQTQRTVIPFLNECGRSPATFGRRNKVQTIKPGDFTWLAAVGRLKNQQSFNGRIIQRKHFSLMCGGTLITHRYVLSAAHCFQAPRLKRNQPTHIRLGEHDKHMDGPGDGSQDYFIVLKKTTGYNPATNYNDIILLKLDKHVFFNSRISPACLPFGISEQNLFDQHLTVVGWGKTTTSAKLSVTPMREEPKYVPLLECQQNYRNHPNDKHTITSNNICAGNEDADACMGDSGGPLNYQPTSGAYAGRVFVVGIVSWGPTPCGSSKQPGVYTNVAKYKQFITNTIRNA